MACETTLTRAQEDEEPRVLRGYLETGRAFQSRIDQVADQPSGSSQEDKSPCLTFCPPAKLYPSGVPLSKPNQYWEQKLETSE